MPLEDWVRHSRHDMFLYDWQTLIAGVLALLAGFGTVAAAIGAIWVTRSTAKKQIDAAREEADRVIAATRAQTEATFKQTEATVHLEQMRVLSEDRAFRAMLGAAMTRVRAEAALARKTYPDAFTSTTNLFEAYAVRSSINKGGFAELRTACVRQGSSLTGEFLDLEREIDSFASQYEQTRSPVRLGKPAGLDDQLTSIETKAAELHQKAAERFSGSVAAPGPVATPEAAAPTPGEPEPRRSWLRWWFILRFA
jgi:hypothetical protein